MMDLRFSRFAARLFKAGVCVALSMLLAMTASLAFADEAEEDAQPSLQGNEVNERLLPDGSFIYETSIEDLANADSYYNGQTVVVNGEVVGDCVRADSENSWILLSSLRTNAASTTNGVYTPSTVNVYVSDTLLDSIDTYGSYHATGSIVQVRGVFNLACVEHDGVSDIHAKEISVSQAGHENGEIFNINDFIPGFFALGVAILLLLSYRFIREKNR